MLFRLNQQDYRLLTAIAEHRVLRARHLAALEQRNVRALRRRLTTLEDKGLIETMAADLDGTRGRPERLVSLSEEGVDLLKEKGLLDHGLPPERVTVRKLQCVDHLLLVNDFRVQLAQMERLCPEVTVQFLSPDSPMLPCCPDGRMVVQERIETGDGQGDPIQFSPDGVFAITHAKLGKTLLFFLEADMGTEPLVSRRSAARDIRQKILRYQAYFHGKGYERYERIWDRKLLGFRLLFLVHKKSRMASMCRLTRDMEPSDFIWLTDRRSLFSEGVWAAIWARGGRIDIPLQSILGSQLPHPAPKPADLV